MEKNNVREILKKCPTGKFIRLSDNPEINISVGYNENNCCSLVVRGNTKRTKFVSTKFVEVSFGNYKETKQLQFTLLNNNYFEVFLDIITDIFNVIDKQLASSHIDTSYNRWLLWRNLFLVDSHMSSIEAQGLIGELVFLKEYLIPKYGISSSILAWGGAEYNKKDYEINDTWYEVKSSLGKNVVTITSLDQLDSDKNGYLALVELQKSTSTATNSFNLNTIVEYFINLLSNDNIILNMFLKKITDRKYCYDKYFDEHNYLFKDVNLYLVNNDFPRYTKKTVIPGVTNMTYDLILSAIDQYKICK